MKGKCGEGRHEESRKTDSEGMKALLASSVPDFVTQHTVLQTAFLGQKRGADGGFFVRLEFVGDLAGRENG